MLRKLVRPVLYFGVVATLLVQQWILDRHTTAIMVQTSIILSQETQIRAMEQQLRNTPRLPHAIPMPGFVPNLDGSNPDQRLQ